MILSTQNSKRKYQFPSSLKIRNFAESHFCYILEERQKAPKFQLEGILKINAYREEQGIAILRKRKKMNTIFSFNMTIKYLIYLRNKIYYYFLLFSFNFTYLKSVCNIALKMDYTYDNHILY